MPSFVESPRFPDNIAEGSGGGPGFKTNVFESHGGEEQRTEIWSKSRGKYDVSYGIREKADMDAVRSFFREMRGRATGFRFKDWGDYELTNENIGTGNGVQVAFPIKKTYGSVNPYIRRIFKPRSDRPFSVTVNNVLVDPADYTVDYTTGIITFDVAVTNTHIVRVTCEFDIAARFDTDELNATHDGYRSESWGGIPIVELKLEDPA